MHGDASHHDVGAHDLFRDCCDCDDSCMCPERRIERVMNKIHSMLAVVVAHKNDMILAVVVAHNLLEFHLLVELFHTHRRENKQKKNKFKMNCNEHKQKAHLIQNKYKLCNFVSKKDYLIHTYRNDKDRGLVPAAAECVGVVSYDELASVLVLVISADVLALLPVVAFQALEWSSVFHDLLASVDEVCSDVCHLCPDAYRCRVFHHLLNCRLVVYRPPFLVCLLHFQ